MYFALVQYPQIGNEDFHSFRNKYDPYASILKEHITLIYPVPFTVGRAKLEEHIQEVLHDWSPFKVHFCTLEKTWDHWLYLGAKEGKNLVTDLHDQLYTGIINPYLREDLPFYPHIGLGLFSKEDYDFNKPTAKLTLNEEKYKNALIEFKEIKFEVWCTINKLTLVKVNSDFTEFQDMISFDISET